MNTEFEAQVRLRCIEAASRNPHVGAQEGFAPAVLQTAKEWAAWILGERPAAGVDELM